jgi:hypothetical protein
MSGCFRILRTVSILIASGTILCVPALAQVSGIVLDVATLAPIEGALVRVQATTIDTTTGIDGRFEIPEASGSNLIVVGAKKGYYYEPVWVTTPAAGVEILLEAVPQANDPNYQFVTPTACAMCHPDQPEQWAGSAMALSGQNRWVYDLYNGTGTAGGMNGFVYTRDSAHAAHNPNSECASCHQPESWVKQPFRALENINNLSQNARRGVSCEICHKIADIDESKINYPGIYPDAVTFTRPVPGTPTQVEYGVFGDVDYEEPYIMRGSYLPEHNDLMCGTCHQNKNDPDEDGDFEEANGIVSEPTFLEWRNSPYGDPDSPLYATCVDCHMPAFGESLATEGVMDPDPPIRDPETIRHHHVEGLDGFLENAAAMQVSCTVEGGALDVTVVLTNTGTGHHLPSGSILRNMILLVRAWRLDDGADLPYSGTQTVDDLGGVGDPEQGYFAGLPGKFYARVLHDPGGQSPAFFTEATGVVFDNRIPALGSDATQYRFDLLPGGGVWAVNARLVYRRAFRSLIDAKGWTRTGHDKELPDLIGPDFGQLMVEGGWMSQAGSAGEAAVVPGAKARLSCSPNPASGPVTIRFDLVESGPVRLEIYDVQGRFVVAPVDRQFGPGRHDVQWTGSSSDGTEVPGGIYLCVLKLGGRRQAEGRVALLR